MLELTPGIYPDGLPIHDLHGAAGAPITISGLPDSPRPVFPARAGVHTVSLMDSSHIVLRGLELDGGHQPADGIKAEGQGRRRCIAVHDIVIDDLHVHDHDAGQGTVGINVQCNAWNWTIRRTVVERVGTGMYLGGSAGDTPFVRGTIEGNLVADTRGYNLQIKHQRERPDVPGMPGDAGATTIRHNVFSKAGDGARGRDARPNVLVGHWPLTGPGARDMYEIYGNFFYQNPTGEPLLQAEGRLAVYSNLFVNHAGDGVWIRPHNDRPRRVLLFWNTVVVTGRGIRVTRADRGAVAAGNAVFAGKAPIRGVDAADNLVDRYTRADEYLLRPFEGPGTMNFGPRADRLIGPSIDASALAGCSHGSEDIEGRPRDGGNRGAYERPPALAWPDLVRKPPLGAGC